MHLEHLGQFNACNNLCVEKCWEVQMVLVGVLHSRVSMLLLMKYSMIPPGKDEAAY